MMAIESEMNQGICGDEEYPLVSIAIITYNQKEYLRECIESCLAQDYPNFEIVVADDASTDGTQEMLLGYKKQYPERFILRMAFENQGITGNSNVCLQACSGFYVVMLGGDDLLLPSKISTQVRIFQSNDGISLCGSYARLIDADGKVIGVRRDAKKKKTPIYKQSDLIESGNSLIPVVTYMFKKSDSPVGGFDVQLPIASDSLFFYHISSKGPIFIVKEELTAYRLHHSHARKVGYKKDSFISMALCEYYYPKHFREIKKARAKLHYSTGRGLYLLGEEQKAIPYFFFSLSLSFLPKTVSALILCYIKIIFK